MQPVRSAWQPVQDGVIIALASWLAVLTSTVEAFFTPFRMFGVLIPIAPIAAAVITPLLILVPFRLTGRRVGVLLPALLWVLAAMFWAQGTNEGDVVLASNNWVAMAYLLVGSGAAAFSAYWVLTRRRGA
jgi:hypothetical protein